MVVQWLGLCSFTTIAQVQFLVGELKSHKPRGAAKKWEKKKEKNEKKGRKRKDKQNIVIVQQNKDYIVSGGNSSSVKKCVCVCMCYASGRFGQNDKMDRRGRNKFKRLPWQHSGRMSE